MKNKISFAELYLIKIPTVRLLLQILGNVKILFWYIIMYSLVFLCNYV